MYVDYKELGRRIAKRRREPGLRQYEVNELAGLSDKYLSNIERASSVPSIDVLMKLCHALKTTPDHLLLGTETKPAGEIARYIENALSAMSDKQRELAIDFMEWISRQDV